MFTSILKRKARESGFTMIELLVVVVIIAILAAISVPVYLGIKTEAQKSALKSDVNATVKKVAIAITQDVPLSTITADTNGAYIPKDLAKGETISIVSADASGTITTASFKQDTDNSSDGYVIRSATYSGPATGVAKATVAAAADNQYFFVYGVLQRSKGAVTDYAYSYTSVKDKFSQGSGDASSGASSTAAAPTLGDATLPKATIGDDYAATTIPSTGTPAPSLSATGLPTGMLLSSTGVLSGNPSGTAGAYTVHVSASSPISTVTRDYTLTLASKNQPAAFTSSATNASGTVGTKSTDVVFATSGFPAPAITIKSGSLPSGLSFKDNNDGTATISGTPTASGSFPLVLQAANSSATVTQNFTFSVTGAAALVTSSLANSFQDAAYSQILTASGYPTPTVTVDKTTLPAGLTAVDNGDGTAKISGTPTGTGTSSVKITVSNGIGSPQVTNLNLSVASSTVFAEDFESYSSGAPAGWSLPGGCYSNNGVITATNGLYASLYGTSNKTKILQSSGCYYQSSYSITSKTVTLQPGTYTVSSQFNTTTNSNAPATNMTNMQVINTADNSSLLTVKGSNSAYDWTARSGNVTVSSPTTVKLVFTGITPNTTGNGDGGISVDNVSVKKVS